MSRPPSSIQALFAEFKRRRVFRVMAVYGVVAFGVLQAADIALPRLGLPDWTVTFVLVLALLGLPIAVVLAWAFEQTPEGLKRTEVATPGEIEAIVAQPASRRWSAGLLALAGVALLVAGAWWMGRRGAVGAGDLNLSVPAAQAADFRTIAVLPFQNVGGDEDNRVMASGLHMDVQAQLSQVADLRVTSPMSVREYEATDKGIREIAEELGVDRILQGSVRRSGNMARVDVQLIDAATSENLWVTQFDEEVTPENLFQIQSRIARAVADQLEAELSPADEARLAEGAPTDDLAALNWYNLARLAALDVSKGGTLPEALGYARRAVELDSTFVGAWALLANLLSEFVIRGEPVADEALAAVERTAALAPGSVEALKTRALYEVFVARHFEQTLEFAQRARQLAPSDADVVAAIGHARVGMGDWEAAALNFRQAVALDPKNPVRLFILADHLRELGMYAVADRVVERMLQVDPSDTNARTLKVTLAVSLGLDLREARSLAAELGLSVEVWEEAELLTWLAASEGNWEEAERLLSSIPADTLYIEEVNRLWGRGIFRRLAGGDPSPFGDSLLALQGRSHAGESKLVEGSGYLMTGQTDTGWALVEDAVRAADRSDDKASASTVLGVAAYVYTIFGRHDDALDLFERIIDTPGYNIPTYHWLRLNATFDSLRADPRFETILEKRRAYEEAAARRAEELGPWLP